MRPTLRELFATKSKASATRLRKRKLNMKHEKKKTFFASIFSAFALVFFLGSVDMTTRATLKNQVASLNARLEEVRMDQTANIFLSNQETAPESQNVSENAASGEEKKIVFQDTLYFGFNYYPEEITELQKILTDEGLYTDAIDGYFGPSTKIAVEQFQAKHGIPVTGIVDLKTRELLNAR